jgi:hypothetical protein
MARAENAKKRRKPFPFGLPADMAQVATNIKTLRAWEFTNSETGEDSVFNGCFPSFGPFRRNFAESKINSGLPSRSLSSRWRATTRQPSLFAALQGKF